MQFVPSVPLEQIRQTVILFRHQHADTGSSTGGMHLVMHLEHLRDWCKGGWDVVCREFESLRGKFHPHEKIVCFFVCVVVGVEDVATEVVDESRHSRYDPLAVFAMN
jgi:hypothetical protein